MDCEIENKLFKRFIIVSKFFFKFLLYNER